MVARTSAAGVAGSVRGMIDLAVVPEPISFSRAALVDVTANKRWQDEGQHAYSYKITP
jgi:hypothetical protein